MDVMSGDEESQLSQLLEGAKNASPMTRIEFRNAIAEQGGVAIPALASWLRDPRLAAFSVRVLQRIAANLEEPASTREAVAAALKKAESEAPTAAVRGDIEAALVGLIGRSRQDGSRRRPQRPQERCLSIRAGIPGRHYWAMRTSADHASYIWSEAQLGRLRQGWGWEAEQDLRDVMALVAADRDISDIQRMALGARRMLDTEPDGIGEGDLIVAPNLPAHGRFSVLRVAGSYRFELPTPPDHQDFGHVIPVELVLADVDHHDPCVSDALRRAISLQPRLYEITRYGGDVEALLDGQEVPEVAGMPPPAPEPDRPVAIGLTEAAAVELARVGDAIDNLAEARALVIFDRLLDLVGKRSDEIEPTTLCVHWPHVGNNYRGTVILGQALYGGWEEFKVGSLQSPQERTRVIDYARAEHSDWPDPNDWLTAASAATRNSPFWTAARLIVDALEPDPSTPWHSRLCWMNLYPVAPQNPKGNPVGPLKEAQAGLVGELLRAHVERLGAKTIIGFVGPYWWSAAEAAGVADLAAVPSPLYRAGRDAQGRLWIVGMHPNGASHRGCSPGEYAEMIARQFAALAGVSRW